MSSIVYVVQYKQHESRTFKKGLWKNCKCSVYKLDYEQSLLFGIVPRASSNKKKQLKNWCKRAVHNAKSEAHEMKGPPSPESARRAYINVFFPFFTDRCFSDSRATQF